MATTPHSPRSIVPPGAPRHGPRFDHYSPYSLRKSARLSLQRGARTPSPGPFRSPTHAGNSSGTEDSPRQRLHSKAFSPLTSSSPENTPFKKVKRSTEKVVGTKNESLHAPSTTPSSLLLTPAKTPRKKDVSLGGKSAAKVLFPRSTDPIEEVTPSRKRGRRNKTDISSLGIEYGESPREQIEIFTDSKERIPELDEDEDNPFYVKPGTEKSRAARPKRSRKPDQDKEIEEALGRDDGMFVVFRGKKFFKQYDADDDDIPPGGDESVMGGLPEVEETSPRRFTRSSVKPRVLFPTTKEPQDGAPAATNTTDEEALTDIETPHVTASAYLKYESPPAVSTPAKKTPFLPATPPSTVRATRSTARNASLGSSPNNLDLERPAATSALGINPFTDWRISKPTGQGGRGKKREASDPLTESRKRAKGSLR